MKFGKVLIFAAMLTLAGASTSNTNANITPI